MLRNDKFVPVPKSIRHFLCALTMPNWNILHTFDQDWDNHLNKCMDDGIVPYFLPCQTDERFWPLAEIFFGGYVFWIGNPPFEYGNLNRTLILADQHPLRNFVKSKGVRIRPSRRTIIRLHEYLDKNPPREVSKETPKSTFDQIETK